MAKIVKRSISCNLCKQKSRIYTLCQKAKRQPRNSLIYHLFFDLLCPFKYTFAVRANLLCPQSPRGPCTNHFFILSFFQNRFLGGRDAKGFHPQMSSENTRRAADC